MALTLSRRAFLGAALGLLCAGCRRRPEPQLHLQPEPMFSVGEWAPDVHVVELKAWDHQADAFRYWASSEQFKSLRDRALFGDRAAALQLPRAGRILLENARC